MTEEEYGEALFNLVEFVKRRATRLDDEWTAAHPTWKLPYTLELRVKDNSDGTYMRVNP